MQKIDEQRNKLLPKKLYVSYFISFLLVFRPYYQEIPLLLFSLALILIIIIKSIKQGNTIGILFQIICYTIIACGQLINQEKLASLGVFLAVITFLFLQPQIYHLPKLKNVVGFQESVTKMSDGSVLILSEWYPVQSQSSSEFYKTKWNHSLEFHKMACYMKMEAPIIKTLMKFASSSIDHYELTFSRAKELKTNKFMLFSHGRTATPFMYSTFLISAAHSMKVYAPQHNEVEKTPFEKIEQIKIYRQKQVEKRGKEILELAHNLNFDEQNSIVLMGHSYGGSTVLQAYFQMELSVKKKVKAIILLDPWMFPLQDHLLEQQIACPILMMANEYQLRVEDIFIRNKKFVQIHKQTMVYLCWKKGDHLHQTDMPFISGNTLGVIKNIKESQKMISNNIEVIDNFLRVLVVKDSRENTENNQDLRQIKQQILEKWKEYIYDISFVPSSWDTSLIF